MYLQSRFMYENEILYFVGIQVELHVHLDGSMRRHTLWELLKCKGLPAPGDGSYQAFEKAVFVQHPKDLQHFLSAFPKFMPAVM